MVLVACVLPARVGFVLHEEESGIATSERNGQELFGTGGFGKPREKGQERRCWGNGSCPGQEPGPDSGGRSGTLWSQRSPSVLLSRHFPALECSVGSEPRDSQASRGNPPPQLSQIPQLRGMGSSPILLHWGSAAPRLRDGGEKGSDPPLSLQDERARRKKFYFLNGSSSTDPLKSFVDIGRA